MGTGISNFRAQCWFRIRERILPPPKPKIPPETRPSIDLWKFVGLDARPLMVADKEFATVNRDGPDLAQSIVFKNESFIQCAAALDIDFFLHKLLDSKPGVPFYLAGKQWRVYLVQDGKSLVATGDPTQYNEDEAWTPAEGWRPPMSSDPFEYIPTERSKFQMIARSPGLDWTRRSMSKKVPEHYRALQKVDWKRTPLGKMGSWPSSLRTVVNTIMVHPYQIALFWGGEYTVLYNASYADVVRNRHPELLGQKLAVGWPEAYKSIYVDLHHCRRGESIIRSGSSVPVDRTEITEECYFDWTLTPIVEKAGKIGGVLLQQYEGTTRVLQNRRRGMLKLLGGSTANAQTTGDFWPAVLELDSPFVALYEITKEGSSTKAMLVGSRGIPVEYAFPDVLLLDTFGGCFAEEIQEARRTGKVITKNIQKIEAFRYIGTNRGFNQPATMAAVLPIQSAEEEATQTAGFILLGINPRRQFDADYNIWLDQIKRNLKDDWARVRRAERKIQEEMKQQFEDLEQRRLVELTARLKNVREELMKNEMRFSNMAKMLPIGLIEYGADGTPTFTNDAWHRIMGIPRDRGKEHWYDTIHASDREQWSHRMSVALERAKNSERHTPVEYKIVDTSDNNSKIRWVVSEVVPVYDDEEKHYGFYSTVSDVTDLKEAEEAQKERADDALEKSKQQERFIDMTCHELRNPLSAILQYSEVILDILDASQQAGHEKSLDYDGIADSARTIILCTTHQGRIIDDILITSKLDSGLVKAEPMDFDPRNCPETAVSMFGAEALSKGIQMSFIAEPSFQELNVQWVRGDPSRIMQILLNLVTNALKFTGGSAEKKIDIKLGASLEEPKSHGRVEFTKDGSTELESFTGPQWGDGEIIYLIITVVDTGIGITDEVQKKLFARFQQAPRTEGKYGGSGLGLYICKNLTKLLGGSIGVSSTEDEGSEFSFYVVTRRGGKPEEAGLPHLPWLSRTPGRRTCSPANPTDKPVVRRSSMVGGFKMLVVEDNDINQRVMRKQLEARGCIVYTADNGQQAVDFVRKSRLNPNAGPEANEIEICLMDCEMPVMNGLIASQQIRQMHASGELSSHLPILGVSANVRGPQVQAMRDAGMDEVISKPFSIDYLVRKAVEVFNASIENSTGVGDRE